MATASKHPPVKDPSNSAVRVEIFDQAYNLRGSDPEYILKLAEYVDAGCDGFVVNLDHETDGLEERIRRFGAEVIPLVSG